MLIALMKGLHFLQSPYEESIDLSLLIVYLHDDVDVQFIFLLSSSYFFLVAILGSSCLKKFHKVQNRAIY